MGNHVHLLLKVSNDDLDLIFKRIGGSYVYWYNRKYYRSGHLFQDRFKSEPINDEEYFLTVLHYIHMNPVKAGICKTVDKFIYCSYNEYIGTDSQGLIDTDLALKYLSLDEFIEFHKHESNEKCLDDSELVRLNDIDAQKIIKRISKCANANDFQKLDIETRDKYIKKLRDKGLSIRQISRLTGLTYGIIRRI